MRLRFLLLALFSGVVAFAAPGRDSCVAVTGFHVTNVTPSSATLAWDKMAQAQGYIYLVSKSVVPPAAYGHYIKDAEHVESGLASAATLYAHVRAKCVGTDVSNWTTIQFNTPPPGGTNMYYDNTFAVSVYPSQPDKSVTIKVKGSVEGGAAVWLEDAQGRGLDQYTMIGETLHIDVAYLEPGIYYVCYNDALGRIQWLRFTR